MPPISRTQVAPVLKAKDYARSWDRRRAEPAVTCHNSSLYMGVKWQRTLEIHSMESHCVRGFDSLHLHCIRVMVAELNHLLLLQPALGSLGTRRGAGACYGHCGL